jgi:hypothetical protein
VARQKHRQEKWWKDCSGVYAACVVVSGGGKVGSVCMFSSWLAGSDIECGGGVAWVRLHVDMDGSGGSEGDGSRVKGKEGIKEIVVG